MIKIFSAIEFLRNNLRRSEIEASMLVLAQKAGAVFILQMDSNAHLGTDIINGDVNEQNVNGKYFVQFLERMPSLTLINALLLCEGEITRMRKTTRGVERKQRMHNNKL